MYIWVSISSSVRGEDPTEVFGDPVPHTDKDGKECYQPGSDPEEKYIPSKLEIQQSETMVYHSLHWLKWHFMLERLWYVPNAEDCGLFTQKLSSHNPPIPCFFKHLPP